VLIQELSQQSADDLMKSLDGVYRENWTKAFHQEQERPQAGLIALPKEERTYYRVESYLVGVAVGNLNALSLSSFARVLPDHPAGSCAMCLKELFEKQIFPTCRRLGKTGISARLTPDGVEIFKELGNLMLGVQLTPDGFYWKGFVGNPS
jgi:hypothetical protein